MTESKLLHQLQNAAPRHIYVRVPGNMASACDILGCNRCPCTNRGILQDVRDRLRDDTPEIVWQSFFKQARNIVARGELN